MVRDQIGSPNNVIKASRTAASHRESQYRFLTTDMLFTHSLTALLALAGSALSSPTEKRASVGLNQAMRQRGRNFIGTAVTFRDDPKEAAIYGNKADFNSVR
jgi:hypothetical protein